MNRFRTGFVTKKADYPLNIEKVISGKSENLKIYGNSYQETKKTKNLLDLKNDMIPSKNYNGIEFVNNGDGTFSVSGTATANTSINILNDTFINELESGVDYVLYTSQPYNVNTFNISVVLTVDDDTIRYIVPGNVANRTWENITHARLALYINAGETIDTAENVKIMLCKSSTLDVEYEEYKVMPSPDFPSEVQSVGEKINNLAIFNSAIIEIEGVESLYNKKNNSFYHKGLPKKGYQQFFAQKSLTNLLEDGKTYSLINKNPNKYIYPQIDVHPQSGNTIYLYDWNKNILSFKVDKSKYKSYAFKYQIGNLNDWKNQEQEIENSFILVEGEYSENNIPPYDFEDDIYKIPVKIIGQNLFDKNTVIKTSDFSIDKDGFVTVTYDNSAGANTIYKSVHTANLPLEVSTDYCIITEIKSVEGSGIFSPSTSHDKGGQFADTNFNYFNTISSGDIVYKVCKTRESFDGIINGLRTIVSFRAGESGSITFRISVLSDITTTSENFKYQPYIENITNIYLKEPLRKIDNYADYIDFKNKKVIRKIKEDVIDGDEKMYIPTTPVTNKYSAFTVYLTEMAVKNYCNGMCDVSLITTNEQQWMNETSITKGCFVLYDQQRFFIRIKKAIASTIEEFKTYLQKNNLNIYYPLKTPIEEELELPNITLFENSNNIFIETKISPNNLELEYRSKKKEKEE